MPDPNTFSRRGFIGTAAAGLGGIALAGMISGCDTVDPALREGNPAVIGSYDLLVEKYKVSPMGQCPFCGGPIK